MYFYSIEETLHVTFLFNLGMSGFIVWIVIMLLFILRNFLTFSHLFIFFFGKNYMFVKMNIFTLIICKCLNHLYQRYLYKLNKTETDMFVVGMKFIFHSLLYNFTFQWTITIYHRLKSQLDYVIKVHVVWFEELTLWNLLL